MHRRLRWGVIVSVLLLRASRLQHWYWWLACGGAATLAIFVRPAYLFLVIWLPIAGVLLHRHDRGIGLLRGKRKSAAWLAAATAGGVLGVLLIWMTARKAVVNEFALVPFGHQNLSALLVQTVPRNRLERLSGPGGELAKVVARKLDAAGFELPDDRSSLSTLTLESQWDRINYEVVFPTAKEMESQRVGEDAEAVRVHRRIGAMNKAILAASPKGYLRWLALGVRRAVWGSLANIAMHPVFLGLILCGAVALVARVSTGAVLTPIVIPTGWSALALVGISYAIFKIGFIILSSPPLGRFADAGAIFVPAIVAALAFQPHRDSIERATRRLLHAEQ